MPSRLDADPVTLAVGAVLALLAVGLAAVAFGLVPADDDGPDPNDEFSSAAVLGDGTHADLRLGSGDQDFYAVSLARDESATARIEFAHADGDLDLEAYDPEARILARSQSITDGERVRVAADEPGRYYLRVYGYEGAANRYDLVVDVDRSS